jgi:1,4-alpha-glucan branching enzyme
VKDLNHLYKSEPALHELQFDIGGFKWVDLHHRAESVIVYKRKGKKKKDDLLIILNMTPVVRRDWKIKVHGKKAWKELFNSDDIRYWGTGTVFNPDITCTPVDIKNQIFEINVHIPALGSIVLK